MKITFQKSGWSYDERYKIEATYKTSKRNLKMYGKWNSSVWMEDLDTGEKTLIWQMNQKPADSEWLHKFTQFALQTNYLPEYLRPKLPRTDSRFRPDQRALENGDYEFAAAEKHRLEEKQRTARKLREKNDEEWVASYFEHVDHEVTGEKMWVPKRDYWNDRKERNWAHQPDLY